MLILQVVSAMAMIYFFMVGMITLAYSKKDIDYVRYTLLTLLSLMTFIFVINC